MTLKEQHQPSDAKPYRITFEERPKYLYVYVTGSADSYEISRSFWLEISATCGKINCNKILIEEDIPQVISMSDMYRIASELPRMGFSGVRVAFFDRYAEQNELNEFGELVAVNRGIMGKIFNNIQAAEDWLLSD